MRKISILIIMLVLSVCASAQDNQIKRIPGKGYDPDQQQYSQFGRSFWFGAEALGGVSCHLRGHNMGFAEIDFTVGYRFSQYLKVGVGIGPRYYIEQGSLRRSNIEWGMPVFATIRGNLMPGKYRKVVPYWGVEAGASVRDGAFIRPSLGLRIGEPRQAFTIALSYMGQDIATYNSEMEKAYKFTNFACLRLGYEF